LWRSAIYAFDARVVNRSYLDLGVLAPFANLPEKKRTQWALTKEEMKNCVWLKPELVAQIEFTEWTPDGHFEALKVCRAERR
jgi:ATP-dependent DNA ligase